jgi:hypothetical protein
LKIFNFKNEGSYILSSFKRGRLRIWFIKSAVELFSLKQISRKDRLEKDKKRLADNKAGAADSIIKEKK